MRDTLVRASRGEPVERHVALPLESTRRSRRSIAASVLGVILFALWTHLFFDLPGSYGYADDDDALLTCIAASLAALAALVALLGARALGRSAMRPALIVGPALIVVTGYDDEPVVAARHGAELAFKIMGADVGTLVDDVPRIAHADEASDARRFVDRAESLAREAATSPDEATTFDWRAEAPAPRFSFPFRPLLRFGAALVITPLVVPALTGAIWLGGFAYAEHEAWAGCGDEPYCFAYGPFSDRAQFDVPAWWLAWLRVPEHTAELARRADELSWRSCQDSPSSLRAYLESPSAGHASEARTRLVALYDTRIATLDADARALGGEPVLVEGMETALRWLAHDTVSSDMTLTFLPVRGLEAGGIEAAITALTGSEHVQPVAPSFTAERNAARQQAVVTAVQAALQPLAGYVSAWDRVDATRPRFLIAYEIQASGSIYADASEAALPAAQRTVYPGIRIVFDCAIQTPSRPGEVLSDDARTGNTVRIVAEPAIDFTVESAAGPPTPEQVYDRMAETALEELRQRLTRALGADPSAYVPPPAPVDPDAGGYAP